MLAVVTACVLVIVLPHLLRKAMTNARRTAPADFTLEDLRRLRDRGSITPTEYEALCRKTARTHVERTS